MPRLITSIPSSRLASIFRSSSANMYGGIASRRADGSARALFWEVLIGLGRLGRRSRGGFLALGEVLEGAEQLLGEVSRADGLGPPSQGHSEVVCDLDQQLPAVQLYLQGAR